MGKYMIPISRIKRSTEIFLACKPQKIFSRILKTALLAAFFWIQAATSQALEEKKTVNHSPQPDKGKPVVREQKLKPDNEMDTRDKEIAAHLEMLKVMDMLEHMDLMKDMDMIDGGKKK